MEDIPNELVINWDHTGINYVPVSNWTMATEGLKQIKVAGLGDKRQLTAVFGASLAGDFLPPQIIYVCWKNTMLSSIYQIPRRVEYHFY